MTDTKPEQAEQTGNYSELLSNLTNLLKRSGASTRPIPSWDSSSQKSAVSIKKSY